MKVKEHAVAGRSSADVEALRVELASAAEALARAEERVAALALVRYP